MPLPSAHVLQQMLLICPERGRLVVRRVPNQRDRRRTRTEVRRLRAVTEIQPHQQVQGLSFMQSSPDVILC